jgi:hypothetical protein
MGRLTLELMRHVAPGGHGLFRILGRPALERSGAADFAGLAGAWSAAHPPVLAGEPVARLLRGGLCLNDPAAATDWLAVFRADRAVCRIED